MKDNFVFVHIPKTAGGSFRKLLDNNFPGQTKRDLSKPWRDINKPKINKDIIHGHFTVDKYKDLSKPFITFVRAPVERVISEFYFLSTGKTPELYPDNIIDFAREERFRNTQYKYIKNLNYFSFVGIAEYYYESIERFERWLGKSLDISDKTIYNKNENKKDVSLKNRLLIAELNQKDIKLYQEVLDERGKDLQLHITK